MVQDIPNTLFEKVGQFLVAEDRNLETIEDDAGYYGTMDGDHMSWKIVVNVEDESDIHRIQVTSILPIKAPAQARANMAELFARINCDLGIGAWYLSIDSGEMTYGINIDLMDGELTSLMFERMFVINMTLVDEFAPTILGVMSGGAKPVDAYNAYLAQQQEGSLQ